MTPKDKLRAKEEAFCRAYVRIGIGSDAYRESYGDNATDASAYVCASRLLSKDKIQLRISELRERSARYAEITIGRVLAEYAKLAFLDIRRAFDETGNLRPIHQMDDATAAAIAGLEFEEVYEMRGTAEGRERVHVGRIHKIKLSDKKVSLDALAKHLGMFIERAEHRFVDNDGKDRPFLLSDARALISAADADDQSTAG